MSSREEHLRRWPGSIGGLFDHAADAAMCAVAAWTLAYHASIIAGLRRSTASLLFAVVLVAIAILIRVVRVRQRGPARSETDDATAPASYTIVFLAATAAAAALCAALGYDTASSLIAFAAVVSALWWAVRRRNEPAVLIATPRRAEVAIVVALGVAFALLMVFVQSSNGDDTFYVNRALYVASMPGPFPVNDTLYADQVYPTAIPLASYEALVGTLGWITGLDVRTLYYLVLAPLFAFLAIVTLWRLARTAGAHAPGLAVVVAVGFLLVNAEGGRGLGGPWGEIALLRGYQGKAILMSFVVPWLWHHAGNYARTDSPRSLLFTALGGVAAIGFSLSGAFVAMLVVASASVAILFRDDGRGLRVRLARSAAVMMSAAYPAVATGLAALRTTSQEPVIGFRRSLLGPIDAWSRSMGTGSDLFLTLTLVLVGWALVRDPDARLGWGVAALATVIAFSPVALPILARLGMGQAAWRFVWVLPVPVIVGLVAVAPLRLRGARGAIACVMTIVVFAALLAGQARWPKSFYRKLHATPTWDIDPVSLRAAERLVRAAATPRSTVAAPGPVSQVVGMVDPSVHAADARAVYTRIFASGLGRSFYATERSTLTEALSGQTVDERLVQDALELLEVRAVCAARPVDEDLQDALGRAGFRQVDQDAMFTYWRT